MSQEDLSQPLLSDEVIDTEFDDDTEVSTPQRKRVKLTPTYLDLIREKLTVFNHDSYLVTITYPGGLKEPDHFLKVQRYANAGKSNSPVFYTGSVEGDGSTSHRHIHLVLWVSKGVRSDSISRSIRSAVFSHEELEPIDNLRRLVVSRRCADVSGALCYIFKGDPVEHLGHHKLPPGVNYEALVASCHERSQLPPDDSDTDNDLFPPPGKQRTIPPSKVPDFLARASRRLGINPCVGSGFQKLVHVVFNQHGIRFDLSKIRHYRIATQFILTDPYSHEAILYQGELL